MDLIGKRFIQYYFKVIDPIGERLIKTGVHPHIITWIGLIFTLVAANFFRLGSFFLGGLFMAIAGTCDVLDGRIARETRKMSKFGAFLDSTIDRYNDVLIFLGLMIYFTQLYIHVLIILAIAGSLLTSYTRARAEGLGIDCKVGLMQRPERITYVAGAAILDGLLGWFFKALFGMEHFPVIVILWFVAIISNFTVLQRIMFIKRKLGDIK
ncbi:MAG: CDP-alcohol phosphatidyltransferase family protein [Candidatus Zixiibacteriota bacterium]|nr:MAG: CDP-alcohol phosphatidyltransferase family protein [candidate division Zixibacteria bacterium]